MAAHYHEEHHAGRTTYAHNEEPVPHGEVVTVVSEADPHYRLTSKPTGVVLAKKQKQDLQQFWVKVDVGDNFIDSEGHKAFILVNKSTQLALVHGSELEAPVIQRPYRVGDVEHSILWTQGKDLGHGYTAVRAFNDVKLNLDADHGDKKHGGIKDDNLLLIHNWNKQENQKWKIAPVGADD